MVYLFTSKKTNYRKNPYYDENIKDKKDYRSKKKLSVYKLHTISCKHIPEKDISEKKRDEDIKRRIHLANTKKKEKRSAFLFFVCLYDGYMKTYKSFLGEGVINHLATCIHKDEVRRLQYMKEKKLLY